MLRIRKISDEELQQLPLEQRTDLILESVKEIRDDNDERDFSYKYKTNDEFNEKYVSLIDMARKFDVQLADEIIKRMVKVVIEDSWMIVSFEKSFEDLVHQRKDFFNIDRLSCILNKRPLKSVVNGIDLTSDQFSELHDSYEHITLTQFMPFQSYSSFRPDDPIWEFNEDMIYTAALIFDKINESGSYSVDRTTYSNQYIMQTVARANVFDDNGKKLWRKIVSRSKKGDLENLNFFLHTMVEDAKYIGYTEMSPPPSFFDKLIESPDYVVDFIQQKITSSGEENVWSKSGNHYNYCTHIIPLIAELEDNITPNLLEIISYITNRLESWTWLPHQGREFARELKKVHLNDEDKNFLLSFIDHKYGLQKHPMGGHYTQKYYMDPEQPIRLAKLFQGREVGPINTILDCINITSPYQMRRKIGEGSGGRTFRVYSEGTEQTRVLKILKDESSEEAVIMGVLSGRNLENIVQVLDAGDHIATETSDFKPFEVQKRYAVLMEYISGHDLREMNSLIDYDEALNYSLQLLNGIKSLQENHIVHRDLRDKNIKVTPNGVLKILDFGLATFDIGASQIDNRRTGVPKGETASDLFSWACITYEMITKEHIAYPRLDHQGSNTHAEESEKAIMLLRDESGLTDFAYERICQLPDTDIQRAMVIGLDHPEKYKEGKVKRFKDGEQITRVYDIMNSLVNPKIPHTIGFEVDPRKKKNVERILGKSIPDHVYIRLQHAIAGDYVIAGHFQKVTSSKGDLDE